MLLIFTKKCATISFVLVFGLSASMCVLSEEDPSESCSDAAELFSEGDVEGALEEARWCVTQLEQLKKNETVSFFKNEINGYKGGELDSQQAMGITVIERNYRKNEQEISVSLTGGVAGGMNNAFAALAAMGMQQGGQGEKIRIHRRTATVTNEGGTAQLVVVLKSGGMLTFESNDVSRDDLVAFAKEFPVADLDDSIN